MSWEMSTVLKDSDQTEMIAFVYKVQDMSFVTYHPSNKQISHFMGRETVHCNLNSNMVEGVGCPVLAAR